VGGILKPVGIREWSATLRLCAILTFRNSYATTPLCIEGVTPLFEYAVKCFCIEPRVRKGAWIMVVTAFQISKANQSYTITDIKLQYIAPIIKSLVTVGRPRQMV